MNVFGKGVAYALEQYLNTLVKDFGSIDDIQVYPAEKRITGRLFLKGEPVACTIDVWDYEFDSGPDNGCVVIKHLKTSKEWINIIFAKHFGELRIPVPKQAAIVAKMIM